jgi:hypothetical protein
MSRSSFWLILSLFFGVASLATSGCGGVPVDDTAAAVTAGSSGSDSVADDGAAALAAESVDDGAGVTANRVRPPVVCGGVICSRSAVCCRNHCFIPRQDRHCLEEGGGASE